MFTILMSVYQNDNAQHFDSALESVFEQTLKPSEVVLVCDGKLHDEHEQVIGKWLNKFTQKNIEFLIVRLEFNLGLGGALREGVEYCTNDYIVRMDSDDICVRNRLELTYSAIKTYPSASVIGGQIEEFNTKVGDLDRKRVVPLTFQEIVQFGKKRNPMNHVTTCINRDSLNKVGNYESVLYHEDYFLWVKFILSGHEIVNIPDVLVMVRAGNDLIGRRHGWEYFNHEKSFVNKCLDRGYLTRVDSVKYLLPRFFFRLMPKYALNGLYKRLRS